MVRYLLVFVLTKPGGYCHAGSVPDQREVSLSSQFPLHAANL